MTDYNAILDAETDPSAPLKSSLFKRIVANPIAIGEGAAGSPRVQGRALDKTYLGTLALNSTTATGIIDLDRHELLVMFGSANVDTNIVLQARFSSDNGGSYGSYQTVGAFTTTAIIYAPIILNLRTGAFVIQRDIRPAQAGTLTVPSSANAFQLRFNGTGTGTLSVFCLGGLSA
jgi:hypothetical protein